MKKKYSNLLEECPPPLILKYKKFFLKLVNKFRKSNNSRKAKDLASYKRKVNILEEENNLLIQEYNSLYNKYKQEQIQNREERRNWQRQENELSNEIKLLKNTLKGYQENQMQEIEFKMNLLTDLLKWAFWHENFALYWLNGTEGKLEPFYLKNSSSDFSSTSSCFRDFQCELTEFAKINPIFQEHTKILKEICEEKQTQIDIQIKIIEDLQQNNNRATEAEKNLQSALKELTKKQDYIKELEEEKFSAYNEFSTEYASAMEDFYKRQGVNMGDCQEHLKDYSFFKNFKERVSQDYLTLNQENRELRQHNQYLEEQVKSLLQLKEKEVEFSSWLEEIEFREIEAKIETTLPGKWKN